MCYNISLPTNNRFLSSGRPILSRFERLIVIMTVIETSLVSAETKPPRKKRTPVSSDYTALAAQVRNSGLMKKRQGYYWTKFALLMAATAGVWVAFAFIGQSWWQLVLAAVISILATQFAFLAHDAGHKQIFESWKWNEWSSLVIANLVGGLSSGWWLIKHSAHHNTPNQKERDPDIGGGVVAFTPEASKKRGKLGQFLARHQGWFFYPLLMLEGLNLHVQSILLLVSREKRDKRWVELSFIGVRLGGYIAILYVFLSPGLATAFLAVQLAVFGVYMGAAFAPNHIGMPLVPKDSKVDFLRRQVLMSRNIKGGKFMSFLMGGLNHQIEHHLFPSMPRPNLHKVRNMVKPYCEEKNIKYTEERLFPTYAYIGRYLNQVGLAGHKDTFACPLVATYR